MTQLQSYHARTRLYVPVDTLASGTTIALDGAQAHYLRSVLRAQVGDVIEIFNGRDGAYACTVSAVAKSQAEVKIGARTAEQEMLPKVTLAFAIVKKDRVQMIVEKATELGAARILPIMTERTQGQAVKQLKMDKLERYVVEAAEQSGRTALADISAPKTLEALLKETNIPDHLLYADEMRAGDAAVWPSPSAWSTLLVGPEGGFTAQERNALEAHSAAHPITLGPRILRAETAALSALTLWQAQFGDWVE